MTELNRAGANGSLGHIDTSQGDYREQIDALADGFRQLGGNAEIKRGSTVVNNPLNAPFLLYVDPYIGRDTFLAGDYSSTDDGTYAVKMRRISNQRLECGYTPSAPFRSLARAAIEAAIITSRNYLNLNPAPCGDNVTIVVQSGEHVAFNGPGLADSAANFPEWAADKEPTNAELQAFNPAGSSGIVLPRGVSVVSMDLRKCRITPDYVPTPADEAYTTAADGTITITNRGSILNVSGGAYCYGFTFSDKIGATTSHHLLSTFEFAGTARLDEFYSKIRKAFGSVADLNAAYAVTRSAEAQITAPAPAPGLQTQSTDTTSGSSPYIYNCSIRSDYGLCGILADGNIVSGLKSMVIAQYTSVSLQKDMTSWQFYAGGNWSNYSQSNYADYINEAPDNVRMDPDRKSFHIRCINRSIIQEVSVFAIGQGIHHWVQSGGELTCTNSNSNFGGCASLAEGTLSSTFATDLNWNISSFTVARGVDGLSNSWRTFDLGVVNSSTANNATTITLVDSLEGLLNNEPDILADSGYSLNNYGGTSYIWIENPNGSNYYAPLANTAWNSNTPNEINVSLRFEAADGENSLPSSDVTTPLPPIAGQKIFVRRLIDTRSLDERFYSLTCKNTSANSRNIVRDYNLQTDDLGTSIDSEISGAEPLVIENVSTLANTGAGVFRVNKFSLRRGAASTAWDDKGEYRKDYHLTNNYYRPGDVVRYLNKHFKCIREHIATSAFDTDNWDECFVHMDSGYAAEDFFKNVRPIILFDKDKEVSVNSALLGYSDSDWGTDPELYRQLRTSTDYMGIYSLFRSLGFNNADSHTLLLPKSPANRERDPVSALDGIANPSGAANTWTNWPVGMRRPSQIRLFGHAMEWAGYLNYSKALPQYQKDLTPSNKFSYYFTNSGGGRVYISAFNEEGFQITAGGLIDLLTGETLSPEGLGGSGAPNDVTIFNGTVVVNGTLEANRIETTQKSLVALSREGGGTSGPQNKDNTDIPSDGRGLSWIAPARAISGEDNSETRSWDYQNQVGTLLGSGITNGNDGFSGPNFITPAWIERWKGENALLGNVPGPIVIFVNPRALPPGGNGTSANATQYQSFNHDASLSDLFAKPPTQPNTAVKSLRLAIQFADLYVSTTTEVRYYLGTGIYQNGNDAAGSFVFRHPVKLYGYNFPTNQFVSNEYGSGPFAFMNTTNSGRGDANSGKVSETGLQSTFKDADRAPVFISKVFYSAVKNNTENLITLQSPIFRFEKTGLMQHIVIWGVTDTLQSLRGTATQTDQMVSNTVFDSSIDNAAYQNIKIQNRDKVLNAFVYEIMQRKADSSSNNIHYLRSYSTIRYKDNLTISEVAIGATGLPFANYGTGTSGLFTCFDNNAMLSLGGLYLIGNNQLDSDAYTYQGGTVAQTPKFRSKDIYKHYGYRSSIFAAGSGATTLTIKLCAESKLRIGSNNNYTWNLTSNNIHLMTNEVKYMSEDDTIVNQTDTGTTAPTESPAKQGPAFRNVFSTSIKDRTISSLSYTDFRATTTSYKGGFAGFFGRYQETWSSTNGAKTDWLVMGMSRLTIAASMDKSATNATSAAGPLGSIGTNTSWNYGRNGSPFRRNGFNFQSVTSPTITDPNPGNRIMAQNHTYSTQGNYLNIKYAQIKTGLDYESNYRSNRLLLG